MRVALVSPLFESVPPRLYGGTERIVHGLCQGLSEKNIDVTVFASADSSVAGSIAPVIEEALRLSSKKIIDPYTYNLKMLAMVSERASEFDLIHNHHDYWMFPLSEMVDTPLLTTTHGRLDIPDLPAAYLSYPNQGFVSISHAQRGPLPQLSWQKTIYHGIDLKRFAFYPAPGKYLAFLGRIDPTKRPDLAIRIAKESGVPLKIAAKVEKGASEDYFKSVIQPHIDGHFIEFIGEVSDQEKSDFLGNALALCFPIDWPEPFGLVMIEALAHGTPVLARPLGSVPEILADAQTGFIHLDPTILAKRVADLSQISRQACRAWVQERFSLQRMTEDYIRVYKRFVEFKKADRHRRDFLYSLKRPALRDTKDLAQR